jgi:hypothetical protein
MLDDKDSLTSINKNICLSGGALGADLQWGMMAGRIGHSVIHWSFSGHKSLAPDQELVILKQDQLDKADAALIQASKSLKRPAPDKRSLHVANLLRRNYYQVQWAESLYAVTELKNGKPSGGTAWAVQMYIDRFLHGSEPLEGARLYLYDQLTDAWFQWTGSWNQMEADPPMPSGVWAGVGTRQLTEKGKWAIRNVMGGYMPPV